jgi:hypothetical protein
LNFCWGRARAAYELLRLAGAEEHKAAEGGQGPAANARNTPDATESHTGEIAQARTRTTAAAVHEDKASTCLRAGRGGLPRRLACSWRIPSRALLGG